jgi:hypothetical protein
MSRSHEIRNRRGLAPAMRGPLVRFGDSFLARIFLIRIVDLPNHTLLTTLPNVMRAAACVSSLAASKDEPVIRV